MRVTHSEYGPCVDCGMSTSRHLVLRLKTIRLCLSCTQNLWRQLGKVLQNEGRPVS